MIATDLPERPVRPEAAASVKDDASLLVAFGPGPARSPDIVGRVGRGADTPPTT